MTEKELFEKALEIVLEFEGYKTEDTGGRTVYGISENAHPEAVEKMWSCLKAEAMEIAKEIYFKEYWQKLPIEDSMLSFSAGPACAICLFDTAVNIGVINASQFYKDAHSDFYNELNTTLSHITDRIFLSRIEYYVSLSTNRKYRPYLRGWLNRVIQLRKKLKDLKLQEGK